MKKKSIYIISIISAMLFSCGPPNQNKELNDVVFLFKKDHTYSYNRYDTMYLEQDNVIVYKYKLINEKHRSGFQVKIPCDTSSITKYTDENNQNVEVRMIDQKLFRIEGQEIVISLYAYMSSASDGSFTFYYNERFGIIRHEGHSNRYFFQLIKKDGEDERLLYTLNELIKRYMRPPHLMRR